MLIIFDLDDTLIETSKCLTPHALERAFLALEKEGIEGSLKELIAINEKALSSKEALKEFCQKKGACEKIFHSGLKAMQTLSLEKISLECVPDALDVLDTLAESHDLALVTAGDEDWQLAKMKKAGIQPERFSKLVVCQGSSKKIDYQKILSHFGKDPSEVIVCGDRVLFDLVPGKELGFFTIHFQNGRGAFHDAPKEYVDKVIDRLNALHEVFAKNEI